MTELGRPYVVLSVVLTALPLLLTTVSELKMLYTSMRALAFTGPNVNHLTTARLKRLILSVYRVPGTASDAVMLGDTRLGTTSWPARCSQPLQTPGTPARANSFEAG